MDSKFNNFKSQLQSRFRPRLNTINPNLRQMVKSGCVGMEKRKSSINTVSNNAHTVCARFVHGSTTTHDSSAKIHHGGATNVHDASTIRYGASAIQAGRATVAHECARLSGCHVTVCQIMTPNIITCIYHMTSRASGSEITPCIKIDKPLVIYRYVIYNNVAYIMTSVSFLRLK